MQSLVVDTNSVIKKLEQRGFSRAQAEGITEALKELDASSLATKTDLKDLEIHSTNSSLAFLSPTVSALPPSPWRSCSSWASAS